MTSTTARCTGSISRRELFRIGAFSLGGLSLPQLLAAAGHDAFTGRLPGDQESTLSNETSVTPRAGTIRRCVS